MYLALQRVLRRQDRERIGQWVRSAGNGDSTLLHRLQERLCVFGVADLIYRPAVLRKNRTALKLKVH